MEFLRMTGVDIRQYSTRNVAVTATQKSQATTACA
jgi:hypothetical protein